MDLKSRNAVVGLAITRRKGDEEILVVGNRDILSHGNCYNQETMDFHHQMVAGKGCNLRAPSFFSEWNFSAVSSS